MSIGDLSFADRTALGFTARRRAVTAPTAVPVNTVAPVIAGTATQGQVLSVTNTGTWTNVPTSFSYQWRRGGVAIAGETGSTYLLAVADVGANVTCAVTGRNGGGPSAAPGVSNAIGPIVAGAGISAPVLALTSTAGASPQLVSVAGDATVYAGMWIHFQRASDAGFTTGIVNYYAMMDGSSWDAGSEAYPAQAPFGLADFVQPTGTYWERCWFETSPGDPTNNVISAVSNTITDTIAASTATLSPTTGLNKSQYLNISNGNKSWIHNAAVGAPCFDRATIAAQSTKWHAEFKYDGIGSGGTWYCGITDSGSVTDFSTFNSTRPGQTSVPGLTCGFGSGATALTIFFNNTSSSPSLPGGTAAVVGDAVIYEPDETTNQVKIYYYRQATGVSTLMATITLTGLYIPAAWFVFGGGATGTGTLATSDSGTFNAGGQTFLMALTAGYSIYG